MSTKEATNRIQPLFRLDDKVAVITGASKGIGESIARGFAEFGAKVVISSRKQEAVDAVAESFRADGLEATGIACHVGDSEQIDDLIKKTLEIYGGIDILVNNAGVMMPPAAKTDVDSAVFDKIMDINVKATFEFSNKVYPIMKERGGGSIIHISSVEGMKPSFGLGLYSVSKAALSMLTKNQAKEWGKDKIRVNAICPGLIKTKFSAALWNNEAVLNQVENHLALGRMALPDEMAGLALFLASDASSYSTGSIFTSDGGHMLI